MHLLLMLGIYFIVICVVECLDAIRRYRIKIIISHSNGSNIFILEDDGVMQILKKSCSEFLIDEGNSSQSKDYYTVPNNMISQLMNEKIVFIVDPRPIGYELNKSLHVVRAICDDIDIVRFLEDSTHDNQQQVIPLLCKSDVELKFPIDPFVPHFPFEFKNPVEFHSNASIQCSSSSSAPVHQASPISVMNWNCWPILIRSLLSHISLLTLSGILAKIDSDRKSKKSPVVPAEQKEKHKPDLNKTKNMSYCGNSHGGDGAELILIRSPLSDTSLLTLYGIPAKIESDRKRTKSPVVLVE
ncbi:hypothetical protein Ahy_A02g007494 [Arachis hypogaea]|uniref:Uncharacterized protein n=1 Tax=Arachis hypogaea TaxID=3818 RepID=A0A445ECB3_ARAHY|nr:hypothetical protein Ahy_A02g007494 [Arachis hypogaea]